MGNKRIHLFIKGRVQGVFFRAWTREQAVKLGLIGWVKNLDDGRVEIMAEGQQLKLEEFIKLLNNGPKLASVQHLDAVWEKAEGGLVGFEIAG